MLYGWAKISIKQLRHQPAAHTLLIGKQIRHLSGLVAARVCVCVTTQCKYGADAKFEVLTAVSCILLRCSNFLQINSDYLTTPDPSETEKS